MQARRKGAAPRQNQKQPPRATSVTHLRCWGRYRGIEGTGTRRNGAGRLGNIHDSVFRGHQTTHPYDIYEDHKPQEVKARFFCEAESIVSQISYCDALMMQEKKNMISRLQLEGADRGVPC